MAKEVSGRKKCGHDETDCDCDFENVSFFEQEKIIIKTNLK